MILHIIYSKGKNSVFLPINNEQLAIIAGLFTGWLLTSTIKALREIAANEKEMEYALPLQFFDKKRPVSKSEIINKNSFTFCVSVNRRYSGVC